MVPSSHSANRSSTFIRYTHKTSGFKTSGFKTSGFKTSETSGLLNVRFTKRPVYKTSGLQNVRLQNVRFQNVNTSKYYKTSVFKEIHWTNQVLLQSCLQAVVDWRLRQSDGRVSFSILEVVNISKSRVSQKGTICANGCVWTWQFWWTQCGGGLWPDTSSRCAGHRCRWR